jgi:uncharacterized protein YdeI (YjbR/CyaY-like superfamily)
MKTDPRIDSYIDRQADFARPILKHLRAAVHAACPECEETLKWSMPHFLYKGEMLAGMAAFKQHATFSFWRGTLVVENRGEASGGMGQFGKLTSLADLPPEAELEALIKKAMALTDQGVKPPRTRREKPPLAVPDDLRSALDQNPAAAATFAAFAPSCQREYVEWISEAKREETRAKRLGQAIEWMAQGKKRNWKYENC